MTFEPTDRNKVRAAIEVLLSAKHCTLYLTWDISHPDGLDQACEALTDLWLEIEAQVGLQFPLKALEVAFASGVTEAMDVDAERPTGPSQSREESMRRHPSYKGPEPAEEPLHRRYVEPHALGGAALARTFDSFELRSYTGDSIPSGQ